MGMDDAIRKSQTCQFIVRRGKARNVGPKNREGGDSSLNGALNTEQGYVRDL